MRDMDEVSKRRWISVDELFGAVEEDSPVVSVGDPAWRLASASEVLAARRRKAGERESRSRRYPRPRPHPGLASA